MQLGFVGGFCFLAQAGVGAGKIEVREDGGGILAEEVLESVYAWLVLLERQLGVAEAEQRGGVVGGEGEEVLEDGLGVLPVCELDVGFGEH